MVALLARPEDLAALLGVSYDPTDLRFLVALEAASETARTYCNRNFGIVVDDTASLEGKGRDSLLLPQAPVLHIASVSLSRWDWEPTELDVDEDIVWTDWGELRRADRCHWYDTATVVYSHGYLLPGETVPDELDPSASPDDLPADLQLAVCQMAARVFSNPGAQQVESEGIGTYTVTYATGGNTATVTTPETDALNRYRFMPMR